MSVPVRRSVVVALAAVCLAIGALPASASEGAGTARSRTPSLTPGPRDGLTIALERGAIGEARYALERFAAAVAPSSVPTAFGEVAVPDPRSGTLLARDLLLRLPALSPAMRERAEALLARPTDGPDDPDLPLGVDGGYTVPEATPLCSAEICVHYVTTTVNRVPELDAGGALGVPDYVETVMAELDNVWDVEVGELGYRPPKDDDTSVNDGGGDGFDVYLTNLGDDGLYGYCTSDDPRLFGGYRFFDFSAYCVLDNDYRAEEYGYADTTLPLRVTAAHEFFHAVQYAYDLYEDGWLLEATATWIEDEVYDTIDDNRQYLSVGPLGAPAIPIDRSSGFRVYGDWIFFRFLTEYFGGSVGPDDRAVVRKVWERADGSPTGPDQFSSQAVRTVIDNEERDGTPWSFREAFRDFGAWNVAPASEAYSEGAAYDPTPVQDSAKISRRIARVRRAATVDHLTHRLLRFVRGRTGPNAKLRVSVDGPAGIASPVASVVVIRGGGDVTRKAVALDGRGRGSVKVDFGAGVRRAVVVIGSASVRYDNCYDFVGPFACNGGDPRDDDLSFEVVARLV
jgi:hypothetical protein